MVMVCLWPSGPTEQSQSCFACRLQRARYLSFSSTKLSTVTSSSRSFCRYNHTTVSQTLAVMLLNVGSYLNELKVVAFIGFFYPENFSWKYWNSHEHVSPFRRFRELICLEILLIWIRFQNIPHGGGGGPTRTGTHRTQQIVNCDGLPHRSLHLGLRIASRRLSVCLLQNRILWKAHGRNVSNGTRNWPCNFEIKMSKVKVY